MKVTSRIIFIVTLFLSLSLGIFANESLHQDHLHADIASSSESTKNRKLSTWSLFLQLLHDHCPPGPLGKMCHGPLHHDEGNSDGANSAATSDGADGDSTSSGGSAAERISNQASVFFHSGTGQLLLITLSALAASVAIAAMYMSKRSNSSNNEAKHPLNGIIKKRIGLFSRMAKRNTCATTRPEMDDDKQRRGGDYSLA